MLSALSSAEDLSTPLSQDELGVLFALRLSTHLRFDVTVELADGTHHLEVSAPDSCAGAWSAHDLLQGLHQHQGPFRAVYQGAAALPLEAAMIVGLASFRERHGRLDGWACISARQASKKFTEGRP